MARQKKPADAVQFTRESAERVARVVRAAELTPAAGSPLTFGKRFYERIPKQVRAATFTGAWPIGSVKTVTFKYAPAVTANVSNLSWPITFNHVAPEDCIVGREGTSWWLVVPVLQAPTAVFVTQTVQRTFVTGTASQQVVTDVNISASLDTSSCSITIGKTASTATVTVASGSATAAFIASSYTSAFLRVRVP
jgi:hypothetical protein